VFVNSHVDGVGLHHLAAIAPVFRDAYLLQPFAVGGDDEVEIPVARHAVPELDHFLELDCRIQVEYRHRHLALTHPLDKVQHNQ
jgi:hypothetical protein